MKTTVELPDKLLRQIKLRAVRSGQKLKDTFVELLRKGLAAQPQKEVPSRPEIKTDPTTGFPYFDCPADAPASRMTTAELLDLEYQTQLAEDLERLGVSH